MGMGSVIASVIMFSCIVTLSVGIIVAYKITAIESKESFDTQSETLSNNIKTDLNIIHISYDEVEKEIFIQAINEGKTSLNPDYIDVYIDSQIIPRSDLNRTIEVESSSDRKNPGILDPNEVLNITVFMDLPDGVNSEFITTLTTEYGTREEELYFYTPPTSAGMPEIIQVYKTGDQAFSAADLAISFESESYKDSIYTHSNIIDNHQITVDEDGWYKISYNLGINNTNYNRDVMYHSWVQINGAKLKISHSYGYTVNRFLTDGWGTTLTSSFMYYLNSGDVIEVHAEIGLDGNNYGDTQTSIYVIEQGTYLYVERLG